MKKYFFYGMCVNSDIDIIELKENNSTLEAEIRIRRGEASDNEYKNKGLYYSDNLTYFRIKDVGEYLIKNGNEIIINSYKDANPYKIKAFLLGSAMGFLMEQRNKVAIHGGSIILNNKKVFIITGESGAGKSTLTRALISKGYKFLADDVSVISKDKKEGVLVEAALPYQKLCKDVMDKMGYDKSKYKLIDECREKYIIPDEKRFIDKARKLGYIIELSIDMNIDKITIEEVHGREKIRLIIRNIYRGEVFFKERIKPEYFKKVVNIAKGVKVFKLRRPKDIFTVNEQINLIDKIIDR